MSSSCRCCGSLTPPDIDHCIVLLQDVEDYLCDDCDTVDPGGASGGAGGWQLRHLVKGEVLFDGSMLDADALDSDSGRNSSTDDEKTV